MLELYAYPFIISVSFNVLGIEVILISKFLQVFLNISGLNSTGVWFVESKEESPKGDPNILCIKSFMYSICFNSLAIADVADEI